MESTAHARAGEQRLTPLVTTRLVLRDWHDADREAFAALNADPVVMEHYPAPLSREESDRLAQRLAADVTQRGWGLWALEVRVGERTGFAGYTGLTIPDWPAPCGPCVEVGWRLARWAWGHGYATEAARAALTAGFSALQLPEIVAFTSQGNRRSRAVMERLGMRRDAAADFDHPRLPAGHRLSRHVLYRLAADEAPAMSSPR